MDQEPSIYYTTGGRPWSVCLNDQLSTGLVRYSAPHSIWFSSQLLQYLSLFIFSVPQIFFNSKHIGGNFDLQNLISDTPDDFCELLKDLEGETEIGEVFN